MKFVRSLPPRDPGIPVGLEENVATLYRYAFSQLDSAEREILIPLLPDPDRPETFRGVKVGEARGRIEEIAVFFRGHPLSPKEKNAYFILRGKITRILFGERAIENKRGRVVPFSKAAKG